MIPSFRTPVGPYLANRKVEYVSALHQTGLELRADISITADDVVSYLSLRRGVSVDEDYIRRAAWALGGGDKDKQGDGSAGFDLVEFADLLLNPHLVRARAECFAGDQQEDDDDADFFDRVLAIDDSLALYAQSCPLP